MNAWRWPFTAALCFAVATILAEAAGLAALWARGGLSRDKLIQLAAVAQGIDLAKMREHLEQAAQPAPAETFSYSELLNARAVASADLDLRDMALDKGLGDAMRLAAVADDDYQQYARLKTHFDKQRDYLREGTVDPATQEVQRQLESIPPQLAKDQLLRILDDRSLAPQTGMHFAIALLKGMPADKRKKILGEFRREETERLYQILVETRRSVPEAALVQSIREQLKEFEQGILRSGTRVSPGGTEDSTPP